MNEIPPQGNYAVDDDLLPSYDNKRPKIGHYGKDQLPQTVSTPGSVQSVNRDLLELMHDSAFVIDPYTRNIIFANQNAISDYQVTDSSLAGSSVERFWTDINAELALIEEVISGRAVANVQTVHIIKGDKTAVSINATPIIFGDLRAMLMLVKTVSESNMALDGMKKARLEWRDTVDAVSDLIILADNDGRIRRCNRATIEFFNCSYQELIGRDVSETLISVNGDSAHLELKAWEGALKCKPGWFEITSHETDIDKGSVKSKVYIVKDITRRRDARQEQLKLYSVIEQYSDGILITGNDGTIEYVNRAFKTTNKLRMNIIGNSISSIKPDLPISKLREKIFPRLSGRKFWRQTLKSRRGHDEVLEEVTVSPVVDDEGNTINYVFNLRDVTETRQLESIAEAVNLMENVGYVFSGIRHELGNPINSVKMALTVLEKNYRTWDEEQVNVFISRCLQELGRVEYLLRTLKNFSLHENPTIEKVGLESFLDHFTSFVRPDFERRGITIRTNSAVHGKNAFCDPRALHQVLINLLANAADAMEGIEEPHIDILLSKGRKKLVLTITDNGVGMSEKQLANLFKPFYTSKAGGSGLGLVIVRKMMVKMDGTIDIESHPGRGTKVYLSLRTERQENDA